MTPIHQFAHQNHWDIKSQNPAWIVFKKFYQSKMSSDTPPPPPPLPPPPPSHSTSSQHRPPPSTAHLHLLQKLLRIQCDTFTHKGDGFIDRRELSPRHVSDGNFRSSLQAGHIIRHTRIVKHTHKLCHHTLEVEWGASAHRAKTALSPAWSLAVDRPPQFQV